MDRNRLETLLRGVRAGKIDVPGALRALATFPYEQLGVATVDHHRDLRQGVPEAVLCEGKSTPDIVAIVTQMVKGGGPVLATRANPNVARAIRKAVPKARYHARARLVVAAPRRLRKGGVLILTAGTADVPVAEEAQLTAQALGSRAEALYDIGVAGVHRLLDRIDRIRSARVLVVVAGMDGVLPSLVGGLVACPVIAVPTSQGYGSNFSGLAPLLTMLNSCAAGVAVVNIDNGYGAGVLAHRINLMGANSSHNPLRGARPGLT